MASAVLKISVAEFVALPEVDGIKRELVNGEIWEEPLSNAHQSHEILKGRILQCLAYFAGRPARYLVFSESAYQFAEDDLMSPDVSVVIEARPDLRSEGFLTCIPEIAVEVVSAESAKRLFHKVKTYQAHGIKEVWIVLPQEAEILIYAPTGITELRRKDTLTSPLLPNFSYPLEELFS